MAVQTIKCVECGKAVKVEYDSGDYEAWKNGKLIQDAFPYLTLDEREMLKTGICHDCWVKMFEVISDET